MSDDAHGGRRRPRRGRRRARHSPRGGPCRSRLTAGTDRGDGGRFTLEPNPQGSGTLAVIDAAGHDPAVAVAHRCDLVRVYEPGRCRAPRVAVWSSVAVLLPRAAG